MSSSSRNGQINRYSSSVQIQFRNNHSSSNQDLNRSNAIPPGRMLGIQPNHEHEGGETNRRKDLS